MQEAAAVAEETKSYTDFKKKEMLLYFMYCSITQVRWEICTDNFPPQGLVTFQGKCRHGCVVMHCLLSPQQS